MRFAPEYISCVLNENFEDAKQLFLSPLVAINYAHLVMLADRGIGSLLLEGGPTTNAAFLAAGCLDELYWTVGARVLATEALPMLTPIRGGSPFADAPREATLISAHRFESELFLRYRFEPASVDG